MSADVNVETIDVPGRVAGTWKIDTVHSHVGLVITHMMVSTVHGHFNDFSRTIATVVSA